MSIKLFEPGVARREPAKVSEELEQVVDTKPISTDPQPSNRSRASALIEAVPTRSSEAEIWSSAVKALSLEMDGLGGALGASSEQIASHGFSPDQVQRVDRRATKLLESVEAKLGGFTAESRLLVSAEAKKVFTTSLKKLSQSVSEYLGTLSQARLQLLTSRSESEGSHHDPSLELRQGFGSAALVVRALRSVSEGVLTGTPGR